MRKYLIILALAVLAYAMFGYFGRQLATTAADVSENAADTVFQENSMADSGAALGNAAGAIELDPDAVAYCTTIHDETTLRDCSRIEQFVANLDLGAGAVRYPEKMFRGEQATVSFVVSSDESSTAVAEMLGAKPDKEVTLKVGRVMAAQLQGDGFKIEPVGLQKRDLYAANGQRWDWKITADKAPRHKLILTAYVVLPARDGSQKENLLKTLELPLSVEVTWGQWFDDFVADTTQRVDNMTGLFKALTLLVSAVAAFLAALGIRSWWRKRKRRKPKDSEN